MIRPAIEGLESAIAPLQQGFQDYSTNQNQYATTQKAAATQQFNAQNQTLDTSKTGQETTGEESVNQQRRGFSEIQQGIQARYGGSTGTGAFANELAGRDSLRNIANIRQTLAGNLQEIENKRGQLQEISRIALQDIEDKKTERVFQAKQQLDLQLADIRRQKGELQSRKAELATQAMQIYQQTVQQVNSANAQAQQQLYLQQVNAENTLKAAYAKGTDAVQKLSLQNVYLPGQKTPVSLAYNQQTNEFTQPQFGGQAFKGALAGENKAYDPNEDDNLF